jgi:hypothetical protein
MSAASNALTREQIKAVNQRRLTAVPVPQWKGHVMIRTLTASEAIDLAARLKGRELKEQLAIQLSAYICDDQGQPLWSEGEARQELIDTGQDAPVAVIIEACHRNNGVGSEDQIRGNS